MATYHITTTGDDGTGDGSSGNPWESLSYACSQVTSSGNTIFVHNGEYNESSRCVLAVGVSILGESQTGTIVNMTYANATNSDGCIYAYSATLTNGNQSISYITLNGSSLTGGKAIWVGYRYNVIIHHVTIEDFLWAGIHFRNQIDWMTPPSTYASNNGVHDCIINNCSDRAYASYDPGNLRIDGQETMEIYDCSFENTERSAGDNGNIFNFTNCRDIKMHDCVWTKDDTDGSEWNFFAEIFHSQGGCEFYENTFIGAATFDFSNAYDGESVKGSYDYAYSIHDNTFTTSDGNIIDDDTAHNQAAIVVEKGFNEYIYVYKNTVISYPIGIMYSCSGAHDQELSYCYIHSNKLQNIGNNPVGGSRIAIAIWIQTEPNTYDVYIDNLHIWNNTGYGGGGNYNYGIYSNLDGDMTYWSINNNIMQGFADYGIYIREQAGQTATITHADITYNCNYDNGTDTIYVSGDLTLSDVDSSTGNITSDPLLTSASDFHLSSDSSPAYHSGINVGLTTDLDSVTWNNPPSMGCYEYDEGEEPPVGYTTYYVKNGGNDSLDGLSDGNAWATISKVNSASYLPGDSILFKCGDTWREQTSLVPQSGSSEGYITYGSYDTGDKPKLLSSKQENSTGDWTVYSGSVWQNSDSSFSVNVGNLIFDDESSYGVYKTSLGAVISQGDFYFDTSGNVLYLYSASNPATYYTNIECALDRPVITLHSSQDYIIIENLDLRYSGGHGISAYTGCDHITISDCDISFIGGGSFEGGAARYGNAIQFWESISNLTISRNNIDQIYDAGITLQYSGSNATTWSDIHIATNLINRCEYSFEFFTHTATGTITNFYIQNNTACNAGGGWGHDQRPDGSSGYDVLCSEITLTISSLYLRNNIFKNAASCSIRFFVTADLTDAVLDYNLYNSTYIGRIGSTDYSSISLWRSASGDDTNSVSDDPLLTSASDWHLTTGSPAIGGGLEIGYTTDYDLVSFESPPAIGAYEYVEEEVLVDIDIVSANICKYSIM